MGGRTLHSSRFRRAGQGTTNLSLPLLACHISGCSQSSADARRAERTGAQRTVQSVENAVMAKSALGTPYRTGSVVIPSLSRASLQAGSVVVASMRARKRRDTRASESRSRRSSDARAYTRVPAHVRS